MGQEEGDPSHLQGEERLQEAPLPGGVALWLPHPVKHQAVAKAEPYLPPSQAEPTEVQNPLVIPQQLPNLFRSWGGAWTADLKAWCLLAAISSWENCFYHFCLQIPRTRSQRQQKAHARLCEKET